MPRTGGFTGYRILKRDQELGGGRTNTHGRRQDIAYPDYFSFGFMRNPWDRLYSCYREGLYGWNKNHLPKHEIASKGFKYYLLNKTGCFSKPAMYFLKGCTYIANFDNFQDEWNTIFDKIGLPHKEMYLTNWTDGKDKISLGNKNERKLYDYRHHYDNEMIEFVLQKHKEDIDYFGYTYV